MYKVIGVYDYNDEEESFGIFEYKEEAREHALNLEYANYADIEMGLPSMHFLVKEVTHGTESIYDDAIVAVSPF